MQDLGRAIDVIRGVEFRSANRVARWYAKTDDETRPIRTYPA